MPGEFRDRATLINPLGELHMFSTDHGCQNRERPLTLTSLSISGECVFGPRIAIMLLRKLRGEVERRPHAAGIDTRAS